MLAICSTAATHYTTVYSGVEFGRAYRDRNAGFDPWRYEDGSGWEVNLNLNLNLKFEFKFKFEFDLGPIQVPHAFSNNSVSTVVHLASQDQLSAEEARAFAIAVTGPPFEAWQVDAALRTDGRARRIMFSAFLGGRGVDQVGVVERETGVLISVVNGGEDEFVNLEYLDGIRWGRLRGDVDGFWPWLEGFWWECEGVDEG
ncbi:alpha/beta-hydrolase [Penicillium daleae]|uniref:Alpha/beta-hydrolase n=1 Tax=Penicillium daleae TaxID=63821 RepID=A0AAD6C9E8_9EURO|nr:alpha/beta-hydrolase [Penicillium daleae]KAJ5455562.1 alpha/beta-hydrolase [Penicillium daleae]